MGLGPLTATILRGIIVDQKWHSKLMDAAAGDPDYQKRTINHNLALQALARVKDSTVNASIRARMLLKYGYGYLFSIDIGDSKRDDRFVVKFKEALQNLMRESTENRAPETMLSSKEKIALQSYITWLHAKIAGYRVPPNDLVPYCKAFHDRIRRALLDIAELSRSGDVDLFETYQIEHQLHLSAVYFSALLDWNEGAKVAWAHAKVCLSDESGGSLLMETAWWTLSPVCGPVLRKMCRRVMSDAGMTLADAINELYAFQVTKSDATADLSGTSRIYDATLFAIASFCNLLSN
eukprot:TRINITY_DN5083_c0_g1_i1.p1 TRINITY_DN5083_c0_g1~~TRINITY_DN5083_c0_g1_i1.p1  ORF type:complete len:293 (+),score=18.15 TRINITY_DN5083_c0_g1_i1:63-941(+)